MRTVAASVFLLLGLGAMSSAALGGTAATGPTGRFIDLDVDVSPPVASTRAVPRGATIDFHSFTGNRISEANAGGTTDIVVRLARGLRVNMGLFPACAVNPTGTSRCSNAELIGRGTAEGAIAGAGGTTFVPVPLKGYNGGRVNGKRTLIFQASLNGAVAAELVFTVTQSASGLVLDDFVPAGSPPSAIGIAKFDIKTIDRTVTRRVGGRRVKVHFLTTPTSCPRSGWQFSQTNSYTDGSQLTATDISPCTR